MSATLFVGIGELATPVQSGSWEVRTVRDAGLMVEDGTVRWVGPRADAPATADTVDLGGGVVLPGFVDAHTHLAFAGHRADELAMRAAGMDFAAIAAGGGGIRKTVRHTRAASERELLEAVSGRARRMLANGTTTAEVKTGYGLDQETEQRLLAVYASLAAASPLTVVPTYLAAHAVPPEYDGKRGAYLEEVVLPGVAPAAALGARAVDMFVEQGYFQADDARRLAEAARAHGLGLRLHVDQLGDHGGAALAAELGAASADHLEHTGPEGIAALASSRTVPVLLPASVLGLGLQRYPDARAMIDRGLPVVLATDFNPGSSPTLSVPFVMALATRTMRMTPDEALVATTVNAAQSLGLADRGTLAPGQRADFTVWDCTDYREVACWFGFELCSRTVIESRTVHLARRDPQDPRPGETA